KTTPAVAKSGKHLVGHRDPSPRAPTVPLARDPDMVDVGLELNLGRRDVASYVSTLRFGNTRGTAKASARQRAAEIRTITNPINRSPCLLASVVGVAGQFLASQSWHFWQFPNPCYTRRICL